ncbi:MAG: PEGA domain-containing protein [Fibrobacteria bacterium]|nr:PEGA domain-containing protein [Fibrobacteria bacterium]
MKILMSFSLIVFFLSCAAPRTNVVTDDQSGTVVLKGTPGYAEVYVNGKLVGKARDFDGKMSVIKLVPGTHTITLKADGYKEYSKKIYLSDTQEVIEFNLEEQ